MDFEKRMKEIEEKYEITHNIFCPHCNHKQDEETAGHHVSYWGEDDPKECMCEECDKEFIVKEIVDRTFETRVKEE